MGGVFFFSFNVITSLYVLLLPPLLLSGTFADLYCKYLFDYSRKQRSNISIYVTKSLFVCLCVHMFIYIYIYIYVYWQV